MEWNCIFIMKTQAIRKSNGRSIPAISCSVRLISFPQILIWYNLSLRASAIGQIVQNIKSIIVISIHCLLQVHFLARMGSCLNASGEALGPNISVGDLLFISLLLFLFTSFPRGLLFLYEILEGIYCVCLLPKVEAFELYSLCSMHGAFSSFSFLFPFSSFW